MKKTLLALALLGASSSAMADALIYAGASVGQASINDKDSTVLNVHVGTGILPILGVEGGITKFGDVKSNGATIGINSVYGAVKPSFDIGPLHLYAKAGLQYWKTNVDYSGGSDSDSGVDIMYGVGAEYYIMGPFSVGASLMKYTIDNDDADVFSLSATFHFL